MRITNVSNATGSNGFNTSADSGASSSSGGCGCGCGCRGDAKRSVSQRLEDLGLSLPSVAKPVAAYIPAMRVGDQVWTSGQLPFVEGKLHATGLVEGLDAEFTVDVDTAKKCAEIATLNALAAVDAEVGLDSIARVLKVTGFVASAPGFGQQPAVVNGASELLEKIFGEKGTHARSAVGVADLPLGSPVEIELIVEIDQS